MPVSLMKESDVDVLVIGAGPAGLMCANALAQASVNVRIVEKKPDVVAAGQADGIQPRTIEVLQSYDLAQHLLREACQLHAVASYGPKDGGGIMRTSRRLDVSTPTARYPFGATLHQGKIESIFIDSMKSVGVIVDRPVVPTSLELSHNEEVLTDPHAHAVKVVLNHLDTVDGQVYTEIIHAKFVVGTDGAHSWVRNSLGITMEGAQTDFVWGVVDMIPKTNFPDMRARCPIHSNEGSCMVIPREGDMVRLYIQLSENAALDSSTGRVDRSKIGPENILDVAKKIFYPYTLEAPHGFDWWTIYQVGQRVATKFSVNERIFIAGDACHTHSPNAGQGMNASMLDTHNLVWKITQVLRGRADISLLKTYEFERKRFAQDLINFDKELSLLYTTKPHTEQSEGGVTHAKFLEAVETFGAFASGIGIHYAESAIVDAKHQSFAKNLIIGKRMLPQIVVRAADARPYELQDLLPADIRFKVLIFAGDTTDAAQHMRVERLAEEMSRPESFLKRCTPGKEWNEVFDILVISSGKDGQVHYADLSELFGTHWSKVFVDDVDLTGTQGGKAYESFGIEPSGAVVIVRPDGYVGFVSSFESVRDIDGYFASFMKVS